jgi:microcystin-dependent protein
MAFIAGLQYTGTAPGTILPCAGSTALPKTLLCDGSAVSRTTYSALFAAIGIAYGNGDGTNTFNLPDLRYTFLRGRAANISQIGIGNIASTVNFTVLTNLVSLASHGLTDGSIIQFRTITGTTGILVDTNYYVVNATPGTFQLSLTLGGSVIDLTGVDGTGVFRNFGVFTNHGIKRTGMRVRITGTAVLPLALNADYYAIVINENNLAFSSTYSGAISGLAGSVTITTPGTSIASTTVIQYEDPDIATRGSTVGGNSGANVGSRQLDDFKSHTHASTRAASPDLGAGAAGTTFFSSGGSSGTTGAAPTLNGNETRSQNVYVNYCIAF